MLVNFRSISGISLFKCLSPPNGLPKVFSVSISTSSACFRNFRSPIKFSKFTKIREENEPEDGIFEDNLIQANDALDDLLERTMLLPSSGHQVLVIQPYIKWGPNKKRNTTPKLQLLESVTLIKTLRKWKVVDEMIISLQTFQKGYFFGKGNLRMLREKVKNSLTISAVFISANTLTLRQQQNLEKELGVPVFDRYSIIMHIFKEHAQTREAKLQVQLAELPYLWRVIKGFSEGMGTKWGVGGAVIGGDGKKLLSHRKEVFKSRQAKLRKEVLELREQREKVRNVRERNDIPIVAVVGYTNSGKTSLIKALTGKKTLEPQDYLFATLDVTSHLGILPSGLKAYFVDTLGFITDIPTYLIESFVSTLEDATKADVIIHVRDVSHPDTVAQEDNVVTTLKSLNLSESAFENIITVGNKIDLLEKAELEKYQDMILISCTKLIGINILQQEVERKIMALGNRIPITVRVETGGPEYDWLHNEATVVEEVPDPKNNQFMLVSTIISEVNLAKFKHKFIKNYKKR